MIRTSEAQTHCMSHPRGPGLFNWFMTVFSHKRSLGVRRFTSLDFDNVKVKGETNK